MRMRKTMKEPNTPAREETLMRRVIQLFVLIDVTS